MERCILKSLPGIKLSLIPAVQAEVFFPLCCLFETGVQFLFASSFKSLPPWHTRKLGSLQPSGGRGCTRKPRLSPRQASGIATAAKWLWLSLKPPPCCLGCMHTAIPPHLRLPDLHACAAEYTLSPSNSLHRTLPSFNLFFF